MQVHFQLTAIALLLGASGISQAALTTTSGPINFTGSASVTAAQDYPNDPYASGPKSLTNTNDGASAATVSVARFNAAMGVLTGVDLQLNSNRTQSISGSGYKGNGEGKTVSGSGASSAALVAAGAQIPLAPAISLEGGSCSLAMGKTGNISCNWGPSTSEATATHGTASVDSSNLDAYAGTGSVDAALTLPSLSATVTQSSYKGQASGSSATYTVDWSGTLQANYSYLLHALASFDTDAETTSLTLDFGNVAQNNTASLNFGLFNLANADRIGLDLDSVIGSGDTGAFDTGLSAFADLAQGGSQSFIANLLTANAGSFSAQYLLNLSDADFGAGSTRQNYQLTLNLIGNVTAVPLPGAVWLFGSALLGFVGIGRLKRSLA